VCVIWIPGLRPQVRGKLAFLLDWSDVQLTGNLALAVNPSHTPTSAELQFVWYRVDESPRNRVGIRIASAYESSDGPDCTTRLCFDYHAIGLPPDNCQPDELPVNGVCTNLQEHPDYQVIQPPDATGDAGIP
jgi:hypothetical protein